MQIIAVDSKGIKRFTKKVQEELKENGVVVRLNRKDLVVECESEDPYIELKSVDVVKGIGNGMEPEIAYKLFSNEFMLKTVDLGELLSSKEDVGRVMGRIIGTNGRMKRFMEQITETDIIIRDNKIYIVGAIEGVELSMNAIYALVRGATHKKVCALLEKGRRTIKESKMRLWKEW
ncbi:MAG: hypothetical protein ACP5H8_02910 [Candidatus Micrarchaeia archaeon]